MATPSTVTQVTKTVVALAPIKIGTTVDKLCALRDQKREREEKIKVIEAEYDVLAEALMAKLDAEGTSAGKGKTASASITSTVVGNPTDWDAFEKYVKKTGYFHLFQRRLSAPGIRELFDNGVTIPGVEKFVQRRLNLLKVKAG